MKLLEETIEQGLNNTTKRRWKSLSPTYFSGGNILNVQLTSRIMKNGLGCVCVEGCREDIRRVSEQFGDL